MYYYPQPKPLLEHFNRAIKLRLEIAKQNNGLMRIVSKQEKIVGKLDANSSYTYMEPACLNPSCKEHRKNISAY